jgi:hypothetical protein
VGAPADAIRDLIRTIVSTGILASPRYVKDDIIELRRVFPDDEQFARAIRSVTARLRALRKDEGVMLTHQLRTWRRVRFSSGVSDHADLRLIFRVKGRRIELGAFGHRGDPESIYYRILSRKGERPRN